MKLKTYLFNIYLIFFLSLLIGFYFMFKKEGFTSSNNDKTILLLGDSMLANDSYVKPGQSIKDYIEEIFPKERVFMLAKNNSTIQNVFHQLEKIPFDLDKSSTYLFLSAGGNDLLNAEPDLNSTTLNQIFDKYTLLIDSIITRLPNAKLYVLTLYTPQDQPDHPYIEIWNKKLKKLVPFRNIIDTSLLISDNKKDLVYNVEPSVDGGKKIASAILQRI